MNKYQEEIDRWSIPIPTLKGPCPWLKYTPRTRVEYHKPTRPLGEVLKLCTGIVPHPEKAP